jgi:putative membrane protein
MGRFGALPILFSLAGITLFILVVAYFGWDQTLTALESVSLSGFAAYFGVQMAITGGLAAAWWLLLQRKHHGSYPLIYWGRLVRDAAGEFLPFSHVGGFVLGARAITLHGVATAEAAASTLADVAVEFLAELAFIGIGVLLLALRAPNSHLLFPVAAGLAVATAGALGFITAQRGGAKAFRALALRIAKASAGKGFERGEAPGSTLIQLDRLQEALDMIYGGRNQLLAAGLVHLLCWFATGFASYVAFHALGVPISLITALAIESILHAILATGFFVPGRIGVQEAAYTLLGAAFGLPPDIALSVSLLRRARDLVIGLPVLFVWQGLEIRRIRPASSR